MEMTTIADVTIQTTAHAFGSYGMMPALGYRASLMNEMEIKENEHRGEGRTGESGRAFFLEARWSHNG
jgi:hypothetical protein